MELNKTDYKRLGDYIREVDVRNRDLKVTKPMGINIGKYFMPSVANIIGTDLSNYKIVCKNQFACNLMHVGRDEKIPIAVSDTKEIIIVSPAYLVFEIIDINLLLPQYLMMWFRRSEFDRNAWFYTDSDVRGGMSKSALLDMTLPIPTIERQREIVSEYETLSRRIDLNNKMISRLEEIAQTLYRKMFVDGIDKENLPDGWRMGYIKDFGTVITGKTPSTLDENNFGEYMQFVTIPDMHNNLFIHKTERMLSYKGANTQLNKTLPINTICVSCIGTSGLVSINTQICQTNQQINSIVINSYDNLYYLYLALKDLQNIIREFGMGGAVLNNLNKKDFEHLKILVPQKDIIISFQSKVYHLFELIKSKSKQQIFLNELRSILLARMWK